MHNPASPPPPHTSTAHGPPLAVDSLCGLLPCVADPSAGPTNCTAGLVYVLGCTYSVDNVSYYTVREGITEKPANKNTGTRLHPVLSSMQLTLPIAHLSPPRCFPPLLVLSVDNTPPPPSAGIS